MWIFIAIFCYFSIGPPLIRLPLLFRHCHGVCLWYFSKRRYYWYQKNRRSCSYHYIQSYSYARLRRNIDLWSKTSLCKLRLSSRISHRSDSSRGQASCLIQYHRIVGKDRFFYCFGNYGNCFLRRRRIVQSKCHSISYFDIFYIPKYIFNLFFYFRINIKGRG